MTEPIGETEYRPGRYGRPRPNAAELAGRYIREWDERRLKAIEREAEGGLPPTVCFSRKIGVGALEVADLLARNIGYRVVDREILDTIAKEADLSRETVVRFDERYPGKIAEFLSLAFGEKAFIRSDYSRHLFEAVYALARTAPTIFVGRGAHLLLPRHRTLAVRCICSDAHRVRRLAMMLNVPETEAQETITRVDKEQREFFKGVYRRDGASPYEFDLVVNFEYIPRPEQVAEVVHRAFQVKFMNENKGT